MSASRRALKIAGGLLGILLVVALVMIGALYHHLSNPEVAPKPLPAALVDATSPEGQARLSSAEATADHRQLTAAFQQQRKRSWCGVASSVITLRALGIAPDLTQVAFFDDRVSALRSELAVTFGGMTLDQLGALLEARGAKAKVIHARDVDVAHFRAAAVRNLQTGGDVMLVNDHRAVLDQGDAGHISPIAAYDEASDSVLVLDTAAYSWPATWVAAEELYAAMNTVDSSSGVSRGFIEVSTR